MPLKILYVDNKDFYELLAQIITFQFLLFVLKEKKMRNYDRVSGYIQAPDGFTREGKKEGIDSQQSHQSQVTQSKVVNVHKPK